MVNTITKKEKRLICLRSNIVASIKKKSNYSVPDYLGALVGDFIRGKKLQEEEREQREKNESEENFVSLVSQRMNVILPIKQCETKTHGRKTPVKEKNNKTKQKQHATYKTGLTPGL